MPWQVDNSQFSRNGYGAGLRIRGGAADVDIRNTNFDENANSGLNITYSGGRRILQRVKARRNHGIGELMYMIVCNHGMGEFMTYDGV